MDAVTLPDLNHAAAGGAIHDPSQLSAFPLRGLVKDHLSCWGRGFQVHAQVI
jgi:hypothetical protein